MARLLEDTRSQRVSIEIPGGVMTVWGLARACRAHWKILVAGVLATLFAAVIVVKLPGSYYAQTDVVLVAPTSTANPNSLSTSSSSLIVTAGIIEKQLARGKEPVSTSSANVTLADQGIKDGSSITLPNTGGQWANNFAQPVLRVQAIGPDPERVKTLMNQATEEIETALANRQSVANVAPENMIHVVLSPRTIQVTYLNGYRHRALGATLLLGLGLSIAGVVLRERRSERVGSYLARPRELVPAS